MDNDKKMPGDSDKQVMDQSMVSVIDGDIDDTDNQEDTVSGSPSISKAQKNRGRIDLSELARLRAKGNLSYNDIGRVLGVSRQAVHQAIGRLDAILGNSESNSIYRQCKMDIIDNAAATFLRHALDAEKINKASTLQLTTAFSQLYDKSRLESGKSNINLSLRSTIDNAAQDIRSADALLSEIDGE